MKIIPAILSQHAEDLSHLWEIRALSISSADQTLASLERLDERLEANLDGLKLAGEEGWRIYRDENGWTTSGDLFGATVLVLDGSERWQTCWSELIAMVAENPDVAGGIISGLGWLDYARAEPAIRLLLAESSPLFRRMGIAAMALHRRDPGVALRNALKDDDPLLRARALKAVGELGSISFFPMVREALSSVHLDVQYRAAWSMALLAEAPAALAILKTVAESSHAKREEALEVALARMDAISAKAWLQTLMQNSATARLACLGVGMLGDSEFLPWVFEKMSEPKLARVAGDAFTRITGVDLVYSDLDMTRQGGFEDEPNDDPKDPNVEMDVDAALAWPDRAKVEAWWRRNSARFARGTGCFYGEALPGALDQAIVSAAQRYRVSAALRLAMRQPGTPLFNTAAPAARQKAMLR